MANRLANYIAAANLNPNLQLLEKNGTHAGWDYMKTLDHILEVHPLKFDVDKLDGLLQDVMSCFLSEGILADIRLAMKMYGE